MPTYVTGTKEMIAKMLLAKSKLHQQLAYAVEYTSVDATNAAKENHTPGTAHGLDRYENQTTMLTRSIMPGIPEVKIGSVEGSFVATMEYAEHVEEKFPFMYPALLSIAAKFKARLNLILRNL